MSNRPSVRQIILAGVICFIPYCLVVAAQPRTDRTSATAGKSSRVKERTKGSRITPAANAFQPVIIYYGSSTSGAETPAASSVRPAARSNPPSSGPKDKSDRMAQGGSAPTKKSVRRLENIISLEPVRIYYKVYSPPGPPDRLQVGDQTKRPIETALSVPQREFGQIERKSLPPATQPGRNAEPNKEFREQRSAPRPTPAVQPVTTTPEQPAEVVRAKAIIVDKKEAPAEVVDHAETKVASAPAVADAAPPASVKAPENPEREPQTSANTKAQAPATETKATADVQTNPVVEAPASTSPAANQVTSEGLTIPKSNGTPVDPAPVPFDATSLNNAAVRLTRESRFDEASQVLKNAVQAFPNTSFKLHRNLSIVYERMNRMEDARAAAATAVAIAPREPSALMQLCGLELITRRNAEAVGCFARLLAITPMDALTQTFYGVALLRTGDHRAALPILEKAAASGPANAASLNALGLAYFNHKKYSDAVRCFKEAIELDPQRSEIRYNLAIAQMASQNKEGATSQYRVLKEENPKLAQELYRALYRDDVVFVDELKKP